MALRLLISALVASTAYSIQDGPNSLGYELKFGKPSISAIK